MRTMFAIVMTRGISGMRLATRRWLLALSMLRMGAVMPLTLRQGIGSSLEFGSWYGNPFSLFTYYNTLEIIPE